jgi:hypothetical protein
VTGFRKTLGILCELGLLATIGAASGNAQKASPPSAPELLAITERGILLNEYDQAAWHASDAVQTANPKTVEGQRWIAKKENEKWTVVFGKLSSDKTAFAIHYEAVQQTKPHEFAVNEQVPPEMDQGFYLFAARAVELALTDFRGEKQPYNYAVLPAPQDRFYVYIYPAQTKPRVYPLGGDVRYLVSPDGARILEKHQMHKSILESPPADKGKKLAAGFHTHVLSDLPEDTDIFHVLTQDPRLPEMIGTPHFLYQVRADGTITLEKTKK